MYTYTRKRAHIALIALINAMVHYSPNVIVHFSKIIHQITTLKWYL
jgi:hypothetical protein